MTKAFNPPPRWPEPPQEPWEPPAGWRPEDAWGGVPAGWRLWVDGRSASDPGPLERSEQVPASGARIPVHPDSYPIEVIAPGQWEPLPVTDEHHGFGPEPPRRFRPRLRLAVTIVVAALGVLFAAGVALLFVRLVHIGHEDLSLGPVPTAVHATPSPATRT